VADVLGVDQHEQDRLLGTREEAPDRGGARGFAEGRIEEVAQVANAEDSLRPIPRTDKELRNASVREREDQERRDAMLKAELAAGAFVPADEPWPDPPADNEERFSAQVARLEGEMRVMPRIDTVLSEQLQQEIEEEEFSEAVEKAEQAEQESEKDEQAATEPKPGATS
jgi:hypothetical protein